MVSEEFMDEIIESEIEQRDENCEKRISGAQEIISSQCDEIEQLKAELTDSRNDLSQAGYDALEYATEIAALKSKLAKAKEGLEFYRFDSALNNKVMVLKLVDGQYKEIDFGVVADTAILEIGEG